MTRYRVSVNLGITLPRILRNLRNQIMTGKFHISCCGYAICSRQEIEHLENYFVSRLSMIVRSNVVQNRTVVVDSD